MEFEIEFDREEDGRWIAAVERLPGVMAYRVTREEARAKVVALRKKLLKNSLRIKRLQKDSLMTAMTDNCDQDETPDSGFGERLFRLIFVLSLNVFIAYFCVRVAWDIFVFSYPSMKEWGVLCIISGAVIYFILLMVAKPNNDTINSVKGQIFTFQETYSRKSLLSILITLVLPILAVILVLSLNKSKHIIQIIPLLILLLSFVFAKMLSFIQFVLKSIQRKLKTGSILPSSEMCNCCKKDKSSKLLVSLMLGLSLASLWLLNATLWTWLLVFHCYQHHSLINESNWMMTAFWWVVLVFWFGAASWIVVIIQSNSDRRKPQLSSDC